MPNFTDDDVLELAQEIKSKRGISLTDAMIEAEEQLKPTPKVPESFTVTIPVKHRVAAWIIDEFGGHPSLSVEDRLGAYLTAVLARTRVQALRNAEEGDDVQKGRAVTLRRDQFAKKVVME